MNTYSQKAQEENLKYIIPLPTSKQIPTLNQPILNSSHDNDTVKHSKPEPLRKDRSRTRDNRKHRKHHNRIIEAKFSEDQDQATTASHQPQKQSPKAKLKKPTTFNDLAYFPKGTLLSLKTCSLQIPSKKLERSDCRVQILSEEEHKYLISQFVDPGFNLLSIKKDKKEADIIQYLSQPTKKAYKYLVCWFEAVDPKENHILLEIVQQANEKNRIFGWHDDHIKLHIMSMRQFSMISKFIPPSKFGSQAAASILQEERLLMIMQYPQRTYELKDLYHPFASISKRDHFRRKEVEVMPRESEKQPEVKPVPEEEKKVESEKDVETEGEGETPKKYWYQFIKIAYEGWENIPKDVLYNQTSKSPSAEQSVPPSSLENKKIRPLPAFVEKIKQHLGIKIFEAIPSDESDQEEKPDLATELLNQLMEFEKKQSLLKQALPSQEVPHYYPGQFSQSAQAPQWNHNHQYAYEMQGYPYNQINNQYYQYPIYQEQNQYCIPQGYNPNYNF